MTRKHFEALAKITSRIENPSERKRVAEAQADYFATQNSNFNRSLFLFACAV